MKIGIVGHGFVGKAVDYGFHGCNKIIIDPATANEFISTPNKLRRISPIYKNTIIIIRDTKDAFSDSITLNFSLNKTIKGIFPTISIIAKSIIVAEINSFISKFIICKFCAQIYTIY